MSFFDFLDDLADSAKELARDASMAAANLMIDALVAKDRAIDSIRDLGGDSLGQQITGRLPGETRTPAPLPKEQSH